MQRWQITSIYIRKTGIVSFAVSRSDNNLAHHSFFTETINGPTLSPTASLCFACVPSHRGNVPDNQQRQKTFFPLSSSWFVTTFGDSKSICKAKENRLFYETNGCIVEHYTAHRTHFCVCNNTTHNSRCISSNKHDVATDGKQDENERRTFRLILPSPSAGT